MQASDVELAAHVGHTISHTWADLGHTAGLAVGILAGAAIIYVGRSRLAVKLAAGVVTRVAGWGASIGSSFTREDSGRIIEGSPTTFYGPEIKPAARMNDRTACTSPGAATVEQVPGIGHLRVGWRYVSNAWSYINGLEVLPSDFAPGAHPRSKIADGSRTVSIDRKPAARKGDGVDPCAGKISQGIESIKIGGPRGSMAGTENRSELDPMMRFQVFLADGIGAAAGGPMDFLLWFGEQFGGHLDERIPRLISLWNYGTGAARAFTRPPSFDPMTGIEQLQRANEYIGRAQGAPGQIDNIRELVAPRPRPTVFDPRLNRWVQPPPPRRLI